MSEQGAELVVGQPCRNTRKEEWGYGYVKSVDAKTACVVFEEVGRKRVSRSVLSPVAWESLPANSRIRDRARWDELDLPRSKDDARDVSAADLVVAVRRGVAETGQPIVWAVEYIRSWFADHHLHIGERPGDQDASWNGKLWEDADKEASDAHRIQKWRQQNGRVGWSLPELAGEAETAAISAGLERVDRDGGQWRYYVWDASRSTWIFRGTVARERSR